MAEKQIVKPLLEVKGLKQYFKISGSYTLKRLKMSVLILCREKLMAW